MEENRFHEMALLDQCVEFLNDIGIETTFRTIGNKSFLPGLLINKGMIIIDNQDTDQAYFFHGDSTYSTRTFRSPEKNKA